MDYTSILIIGCTAVGIRSKTIEIKNSPTCRTKVLNLRCILLSIVFGWNDQTTEAVAHQLQIYHSAAIPMLSTNLINEFRAHSL